MDLVVQDLRQALRRLRSSPGFVTVAALTLALGFGVNTAMFSVIRGVLLRPLPYRDPGRLVMIWEHYLPRQQDHNVVAPANYLRWKERASSFTDLAMYTWASTVFTGGEASERVSGRAVTPNLFPLLGVAPVLGRGFTAEEGKPGAPDVIILSHGLWQQRFGGDSSIVGHEVPIAGGTATVVGVMPAGFRPLGSERYWEPFPVGAKTREPRGRYVMVLGRLKPGVTPAMAQAEMTGVAAAVQQEIPDFDTGWTATVVTLKDEVVGRARQLLLVLLGAVGLVLLIACANVANLTLARAAGRAHDTAVRLALGAPRRRLARQWLTESLLVALLGGVLGVVLAVWGVDLLKSLAGGVIPRAEGIAVDPTVLAATGGLVLVIGGLAGLPAALGMGAGPASLRESVTRTTAGRAAVRWRRLLVVTQLALALVLLAGAGLMIRSLRHVLAVNPGFDPDHVLTVALSLPSALYPDAARQNAFFDRVGDEVRALPGVRAAGTVSALPLTGLAAATSFRVVGRPPPPPGHRPSAKIRMADSGYFPAMGIALLRGRLLRPGDAADAAPVAVINQTMARQLWPDQDPVGARVQVNWTDADARVEIVGVVADVHHDGLDAPPWPMLYYPRSQENSGRMVLVVRTTGDPAPLAGPIRALVHRLDPALPLGEIATMSHYVEQSVSDRRYPMLLLGLFAALAVTLAAIGLYGVVSYGVGLRTREFGVRIALGARPGDVTGLVLRSGAALALAGVVLGLLGAALTTRVLGHLLFQVKPADPLTLVTVAVFLVGVVLVAAWMPARRAARVDPIEALRAE